MNPESEHRWTNRLPASPAAAWLLCGFAITFLWFYIVPIFLDASQTMQFPRYIRTASPIGNDLWIVVGYSYAWLHSPGIPTTVHPPFTLIYFAPFTFLDQRTAYAIQTALTLTGFVLITLVLPGAISQQRSLTAATMLVFVTGLISYGMQFELERGNWNVTAFAVCLIAIYVFHRQPKRRWLAYVLFTVAVQLKLWPAIFVFALIDDWSDWRNNLKRLAGLGLLNLAALCMLGVDPVLREFRALAGNEIAHTDLPFNLSISSFMLHILILRPLRHNGYAMWLLAHSGLTEAALVAAFVVWLLFVIRQAHRRGSGGLDPCVFMACTVGALIIPSISLDYKLAVLPAAMVLLIPAMTSFAVNGRKASSIVLAILLAAAYSSTLYPLPYKAEWMQYGNLPALLLMLAICTVWSGASSSAMAEGGPAVREAVSVAQ
jgi:hypothetical protein